MLYGKALHEPSQAELSLGSAWLSFLNQAEPSQDLKLSLVWLSSSLLYI